MVEASEESSSEELVLPVSPTSSSSSSEHSARSRAKDSCAKGEDARKELLNGDLAIEACLPGEPLMGLDGVDIVLEKLNGSRLNIREYK